MAYTISWPRSKSYPQINRVKKSHARSETFKTKKAACKYMRDNIKFRIISPACRKVLKK